MSAIPRAIAEHEITCRSYPFQVEGRLWDGPWFYFRIRSGRASLGFGRTFDEAVDDSIDGHRRIDCDDVWSDPTEDEAWAIFDRLLAMKASR